MLLNSGSEEENKITIKSEKNESVKNEVKDSVPELKASLNLADDVD